MPENTVKVDRTTPWGNPFVVGEFSVAADCVEHYKMMLAGYLTISCSAEVYHAQRAVRDHAAKHLPTLRGKNLACWCALGAPCHADVLLEIANA